MSSRKAPDRSCPDCAAIFYDFNQLTGRRYRVVGDAARYCHARHQEYSVDECKAVAKYKYLEWRDNRDMAKHIDPLTFFRESNFDRYLNQMLADEIDMQHEARKNETFEEFLDRSRKERSGVHR